MDYADFAHFAALDIRAGTVTRAEAFPEARRPAIKLWVDFGPEIGEKKSSAQIGHQRTPWKGVGSVTVGERGQRFTPNGPRHGAQCDGDENARSQERVVFRDR